MPALVGGGETPLPASPPDPGPGPERSAMGRSSGGRSGCPSPRAKICHVFHVFGPLTKKTDILFRRYFPFLHYTHGTCVNLRDCFSRDRQNTRMIRVVFLVALLGACSAFTGDLSNGAGTKGDGETCPDLDKCCVRPVGKNVRWGVSTGADRCAHY